MRLSKTKRESSIGFNITPMIDIVFLLIIFFMTVSQITRVVDHPVALPVVAGKHFKSVSADLTINLNANGKMIVAEETIKKNDLIEMLANSANFGEPKNGPLVELRIDKTCPSDSVNDIIETLSEMGVVYLKLAVSSEK